MCKAKSSELKASIGRVPELAQSANEVRTSAAAAMFPSVRRAPAPRRRPRPFRRHPPLGATPAQIDERGRTHVEFVRRRDRDTFSSEPLRLLEVARLGGRAREHSAPRHAGLPIGPLHVRPLLGELAGLRDPSLFERASARSESMFHMTVA